MQVERKNFTFQLKLGGRGWFLRIVENSGGRSNEIIVPVAGLEDFKNLADDMVRAANESPSAAGAEPNSSMSLAEEALKTEKMQLEHKSFTFLLRQNKQGRFLRITEEKNNHFSNIIIPAEGLEEFKKWVVEMAKASKKLKK